MYIIFSTASLLPQVNIEKNRNLGEDEKFAGSVDFNLQVKSGNVDVLDAGTGIGFQYDAGRNFLFLISNAQYATKNSNTFINRGFAHLR